MFFLHLWEKNPNRSSNFELGKIKIITEIHVSSFCEEKTYEATSTTTNYGIEKSAIIGCQIFCNTL